MNEDVLKKIVEGLQGIIKLIQDAAPPAEEKPEARRASGEDDKRYGLPPDTKSKAQALTNLSGVGDQIDRQCLTGPYAHERERRVVNAGVVQKFGV